MQASRRSQLSHSGKYLQLNVYHSNQAFFFSFPPQNMSGFALKCHDLFSVCNFSATELVITYNLKHLGFEAKCVFCHVWVLPEVGGTAPPPPHQHLLWLHVGRNSTARNVLPGITPLKKLLCYYPSPTTLQVAKSHNSPPSRNYNNSKVAEASIKGNFNKAKSLTGGNKELQQNIMKDRAGWSSVYFVLLSNTRLWKKVKVSLR